jgi:hypothetical protein
VLLKLIQPYTRVRLPFISHALHIPEGDVERLLVSLILDNRIEGYVDQVGGGQLGDWGGEGGEGDFGSERQEMWGPVEGGDEAGCWMGRRRIWIGFEPSVRFEHPA